MYLDRLCVTGQVAVVTGGGQKGWGCGSTLPFTEPPLVTASVANVPRSPVWLADIPMGWMGRPEEGTVEGGFTA